MSDKRPALHHAAHPQSAEVEFKLADLWRQKGKTERAMEGFRRAIRSRPDYLPAYLELINLLAAHGRLDEAIALCGEAIRHNPRAASLKDQREILLLRQRDAAGEESLTPLPAPGERPGEHQARLLFYTDASAGGGVEQFNHSLMCGLRVAGYAITCAQGLARNHRIEAQCAAGIDHAWLADDDLYDPIHTPRAFANTEEAEAVFAAAQPDLVVFSSGSPVSSLAAKEAAVRLHLPFLIIVHSVTTHWLPQFAPYIERLRDIHHHARTVIAVSQDNLDALHQHFYLSATRGEVILNGVAPAFFQPPDAECGRQLRQELGIDADAIVVLTVARLARTKGYHLLLEVASALRDRPIWPRLKFAWVGSGTYESRLRVVAEERGIADHIEFLGNRSDIPELLGMADMFVLVSDFEGMPLAVMEAMAKGLPVMAAAVGGIPEQLGETGKLLPAPKPDPRETIRAAAATMETWALDAELRSRLGSAGRERAEALFQADRMRAEYENVIQRSLVP